MHLRSEISLNLGSNKKRVISQGMFTTVVGLIKEKAWVFRTNIICKAFHMHLASILPRIIWFPLQKEWHARCVHIQSNKRLHATLITQSLDVHLTHLVGSFSKNNSISFKIFGHRTGLHDQKPKMTARSARNRINFNCFTIKFISLQEHTVNLFLLFFSKIVETFLKKN